MKLTLPIWLDSVDSTNTVLSRLIRENGIVPGHLLAAREQTAGRGRYDRRWQAQAGKNLTFSFYLKTAQGFPQVASIPVAAALGVADYLREVHHLPAQAKWPNDVMIGGKKICGILSERTEQTSATPTSENDSAPKPASPANHIVVGIGINLNLTAEDAVAIEKPATSVFLETGVQTVPEAELLRLMPFLDNWLTKWEVGGFSALSERWTAWAWRLGETVAVGDGNNRQTGILQGFGESGELILRLPDGSLRACWAGDFEY